MRVLLQRVSQAAVAVDGREISRIDRGLLVLAGVEHADTREDATWLAGKVAKIRIFADAQDRMNLSVADVAGGLLVVSQFTLHAATQKGNRPSFIRAAPASHSEPLFEFFCEELASASGIRVQRGVFGANMQVSLENDGPVTVWIDSRARE